MAEWHEHGLPQDLLETVSGVLEESAIWAEDTNSRVEFSEVEKKHQFQYGERHVGVIMFGSDKRLNSIGRLLVIDKNHNFDVKEYGTKFVARLANNMTKMNNGVLSNATAVKLNLKTGTYSLPTEDAMAGITDNEWTKPVKFKKLIIQNFDLAKSIGWVK